MVSPTRQQFDEELRRTAFQRKAVSRLPVSQVLDLAIEFFTARGYRSARTGRPNQVFVMGGREGILPRVTGEIAARADVGKPGVTMITMDAAGEKLGPVMLEFYQELRKRRQQAAKPDPGASTP